MEIYEGGGINDVYAYAVADTLRFGRKVRIDRPDAVDSHTVEVTPNIFVLSNPMERLVTAHGRPVNVAFALAEVLHILGGRKDVEMLAGYNSTIGQFSDDGVSFNASYGYRMRHSFGHDQIEDVIRTLQDDRSSRQGTLVISNPVDDKGWNRQVTEDPSEVPSFVYSKKQTKDRACNLVSHAMIRDGRLDWMQVMRSNDLIWGTPYNLMQFGHLMEYVARRVNAEPGQYTHMAHSSHIYSHHFAEAERIQTFDLYKATGEQHQPMWADDEAINVALREEQVLRTRGVWDEEAVGDLSGGYWFSALQIMEAHRHFQDGEDMQALESLQTNRDAVLALAHCRFLYHTRWHKPGYEAVVKEMYDGLDNAEIEVWLAASKPVA